MRERTKTRLSVQMGSLIVGGMLLKAMEREVVDRVSILYRDSAGSWWWVGHRKVGANGRAMIEGNQVVVSPQKVEVENVGEVEFMVADNYSGQKHPAPFPLDSMEDVAKYKSLGVHGGVSGHAIARALGWTGGNASRAGELLREVVAAGLKYRDTEALAEARAAAGLLVEFPDAAEAVKASLSWRDVADLLARVERLEAEVETLKQGRG